jgi:hypothetical protein
MNRIAKFLIAGTLAIGFAAGGFASASGSAPDATNGDSVGHPYTTPIDPQIQAQGITSQTGFVPITPCRVADTRKANAGKLPAQTARDFNVAGNLGFDAQGGRPGGCGLPPSASAAVLALTSTNSTSNAFVVGWPSGQPKPNATALTEQKGVNVTSESTQRLGNSGKVTMISSGATDLIIDVVGYYREPIAVRVASDGSAVYHSDHVTSVQRLGVGTYRVYFNVNVFACAGQATSDYSANNVSVNMESLSALIIVRNVTAQGTPYADGDFALSVTC